MKLIRATFAVFMIFTAFGCLVFWPLAIFVGILLIIVSIAYPNFMNWVYEPLSKNDKAE